MTAMNSYGVELLRPRRHMRLVLGVAAAMLLSSVRALSQARFEWPDVPVHLEQYTLVEDCLAATHRLRDSVEHNGVFRDTVPFGAVEARAPLPAAVTMAAQRCGARFREPVSPLRDFAPLAELYLTAGRDTDVTALVQRRLAGIAATSREREFVLDTIAHIYLNAQPIRLDEAERFTTEFGALTKSPWVKRMSNYLLLMQEALRAADTTRAKRAANGVLSVGNSLSSADRRTLDGQIAVTWEYAATETLHREVLLDSLRRSTAGFIALRMSDWSKSSGERASAMNLPIGQAAPSLEADYWFRHDTAQRRPARGKVSYVVFLDHEACAEASNPCSMDYAVLRRIARRFPELEITLVDQTRGYLGQREPLAPEAEADTVRRWWFEKDHLPGALAIAKTAFWRLPQPDGRRVDLPVANTTHYSFGRHWPVHPFSGYVVDRAGTIVDAADLNRWEEERLGALLEAVFAQPRSIQ